LYVVFFSLFFLFEISVANAWILFSFVWHVILKQSKYDAVDPQGDERCKAARKQAVKLAQNILYYLDMKTDEWEY